MKLGIIGFGNMASAIVGGVLQKRVLSHKDIFIFDNSPIRNKLARKKFKVNISKSISELCAKTDVLLIAVKPQQINEVLPSLAVSLRNHLVITIVTGIASKFYRKFLGERLRLIRVMPNTPALIGLGAAAYYAGKQCSTRDKRIVESLFNSVGILLEIKNEALLNAVTAISGFGPAFIYTYAQAVMTSAQKLGLSTDVSRKLVLQTLLGATQMMLRSTESPEELTKKVTSKGGTTLAGLKVLKKKRFTKIVEACMIRAAKRAEELSKLFGSSRAK